MLPKILVLGTADILASYALWTLMVYLTDVWKLSFTHVAVILNLYMGFICILALIMQVIVDTMTGHYWMLLSSSIAYCRGLGFLSMSTPPVLPKVSGKCGSYEPECITDTSGTITATFFDNNAEQLLGLDAKQAMDEVKKEYIEVCSDGKQRVYCSSQDKYKEGR